MNKRTCKGCNADISHRHPNCKFHSNRCKDNYHNYKNPNRQTYSSKKNYKYNNEEFSAHDFSNEDYFLNKE